MINEIYGVKGIEIIPRKKVLKQKPYYATVRLIPDKLALSLLFTSVYSLVITDSFFFFFVEKEHLMNCCHVSIAPATVPWATALRINRKSIVP